MVKHVQSTSQLLTRTRGTSGRSRCLVPHLCTLLPIKSLETEVFLNQRALRSLPGYPPMPYMFDIPYGPMKVTVEYACDPGYGFNV